MCSQYTLYQNIMHGNKCIKEIYLSQAPLKTRGPIFYVEVCFQSQYNARKSKGNRRNRVCLYHLPRNLGQKVEWRTTCVKHPVTMTAFWILENLLNRENRGHKKWRQPKLHAILFTGNPRKKNKKKLKLLLHSHCLIPRKKWVAFNDHYRETRISKELSGLWLDFPSELYHEWTVKSCVQEVSNQSGQIIIFHKPIKYIKNIYTIYLCICSFPWN